MIYLIFLSIIIGIDAQFQGTQGAATHPAGLNPQLCPNFPQCDNAILAAFAHLPQLYSGKGQGMVENQPGAPAKYPPGINPLLCPNYPFCHAALLG